MASLFSADARLMVPYLNEENYVDNSLSKDMLGLIYHSDVRKSIVEMAYTMIDLGLVPDKRQK